MTITVEVRELTLNDRCDACQAAAKVVATLLNGELLFCGHHAREYGTSLVTKSLRVYDPEGVLNLIQ
jgi:phage FluMu protein gp41